MKRGHTTGLIMLFLVAVTALAGIGYILNQSVEPTIIQMKMEYPPMKQTTGSFVLPQAKEYGGAIRGVYEQDSRAFPGRATEVNQTE